MSLAEEEWRRLFYIDQEIGALKREKSELVNRVIAEYPQGLTKEEFKDDTFAVEVDGQTIYVWDLTPKS